MEKHLDAEYIFDNRVSVYEKLVGLYFLFDYEDDLIYIGQTRDLYARLSSHRHKAFRSWSFVPCSVDLRKRESEAILKFCPPINRGVNKDQTNLVRYSHLKTLLSIPKGKITQTLHKHPLSKVIINEVVHYHLDEVFVWAKTHFGLVRPE